MTGLRQSVGATQRTHRGVFFDWPKDQVPDGGFSDGQNVEPIGLAAEFGGIGKVPGWAKYSGTAIPGTGPVMLVAEFVKSTGAREVLACSTTRLSKYNVGTNVFDDVTAGANLLSGTATQPVFHATLNDLFIVGSRANNPRKWNGTAWGLLGGTPPKFTGFDVYEGHLLGWGVDDGTVVEYRAQWSGLNAPETWAIAAGEEQGALDLREENLLGILAGAKLGRQFLLYKEQLGGVYALTYVGLPLVMVQELAIPRLGVFSPRGVASHGGAHFVLASDEQLYIITQSGKEAIGDAIRKRIFSRLNWNARAASWVAVNPLRQQVIFAIPEGSAAVASRAYLLNYRTGAWGERELPMMCGALIRDPETTVIDDLAGTIDALSGSIDNLSALARDTFFVGGEGSSAHVYRYASGESMDGTAISSWVVGRWVGSGGGRMVRVRGVEVDARWTGLLVDIGTAGQIDGAMTFTELGTMGSRGRVDANVSAQYVAPRFRSAEATDTWEVSGSRMDMFPLGRR